MERVKITTFLLFVAFLALLPKMEGQPLPKMTGQPWPRVPPLPSKRPLCASQFSLANYACQAIPYTPGPPPLPPSPDDPDMGRTHTSPDDPDMGRTHNHSHRHRHRHRHRGRHSETQEQEECCRWLRAVDDECVCELLLHLPAFLSKPLHNFTVIIDESCDVTYECEGRLLRG